MTLLAPLLESYFSDRLQRLLRASPCTIAAYRDAFRLLLAFAKTRLGKEPSSLLLADLDAPVQIDDIHLDAEQLTHAGRDPHRSTGSLRRDYDPELGDPDLLGRHPAEELAVQRVHVEADR